MNNKDNGMSLVKVRSLRSGVQVEGIKGKITKIANPRNNKQHFVLYDGTGYMQIETAQPVPSSWKGFSIVLDKAIVYKYTKDKKEMTGLRVEKVEYFSEIKDDKVLYKLDPKDTYDLRMKALELSETFLSRVGRSPVYSTWHVIVVAKIFLNWIVTGNYEATGIYNKVEIPKDRVTASTAETLLRMMMLEGYDKTIVESFLKSMKTEMVCELSEKDVLSLINSMRKKKFLDEQQEKIEERRRTG